MTPGEISKVLRRAHGELRKRRLCISSGDLLLFVGILALAFEEQELERREQEQLASDPVACGTDEELNELASELLGRSFNA